MRSPNRPFLLIISVLAALAWACSSNQFPEQRVSASTSKAQSSQEESRTVAAIVKARKANLRDGPSASATIVSTVNKGDLLSLIGAKPVGPWYQIRDSKTGSEGWIYGNTIDLLQTEVTNSARTTQTQRPRRVASPTSGKTYVNVDGIRVRSPVFSDTKPEGASARCRDGSYSFSLHRRGTCSHHGGVAEWY